MAFSPKTIFKETFILDVWDNSEYASAFCSISVYFYWIRAKEEKNRYAEAIREIAALKMFGKFPRKTSMRGWFFRNWKVWDSDLFNIGFFSNTIIFFPLKHYFLLSSEATFFFLEHYLHFLKTYNLPLIFYYLLSPETLCSCFFWITIF